MYPKVGNPPSNPANEGQHPHGGPLLSVAETASYLNVSERWVRHAVFHRYFPVTKVGRYVRIARADLDSWLARNREDFGEGGRDG